MNKEPIVPKEVVLPFVLITSLFALWGFANAVTDPMVTAFKKVLELNNTEASLVQMAFYGGYFTMALPAAIFSRRYNYKTGVIIGLSLYAIGAFLFYPAAITQQFSFFLAGLYILTFGLAFLETTANPYILSMGSPKTATQRLNLAQAFNPMGLIAGLLVAQQFVLRRLESDNIDFSALDNLTKASIRTTDLLTIRDPYLALGIVVVFILILILVNKMPESKDNKYDLSLKETIKKLVVDKKYTTGVIAQVFYVGAQIMIWTYIYHYAEAIGLTAEEAGSYQFAAFILFFIGRFFFTYLLRFIKSGKLLASLAILAMVLMMGTIFGQGMWGLYCLVATSFALSIMFPTIYGISLQGLSEGETKVGAAGLVMAIVGGALMPTLQGFILDLGGSGLNDLSFLGVPEVNISFALPLLCFMIITIYGLRVNKLYKL